MQIVVAAGADWGIGRDGTQQLVASADRRYFKNLTTGGVVIAGRRTLADFPGGKALPGRVNIVLSKNPDFAPDGAVPARSVAELFAVLRDYDDEKTFVIGGGSVYRLLLPYSRFAHVTRFEASPVSDTFFPNLDETPGWELIKRGEPVFSDGFELRFCLYENRRVKGRHDIV